MSYGKMISIGRNDEINVGDLRVRVDSVQLEHECFGLPIFELQGNVIGESKPVEIERVIFNDPATIVMWKDGTKTVVKCQEDDSYNEQTGLLMCIAKKHFGNTGRFNDVLHEWVPQPETNDALSHIFGDVWEVLKAGLTGKKPEEPSFDWEAFKAGKIAVDLKGEEAIDDYESIEWKVK